VYILLCNLHISFISEAGTKCKLFMRTKRPQHIVVPRNTREL